MAVSEASFHSLPRELIENIANNVTARALWNIIGPLNKSFYAAISSKDYWLRRIKNVNNVELLPRIRDQQNLESLIKVSVMVEENEKRFGQNECLKDCFTCNGHISTTDAFFCQYVNGRRMLFSGARDHKVVIWDLQKAVEEKSLNSGIKFEFNEAHSGWIWAITAYEEQSFFTGSWDNEVKCWRYGESAVMENRYNASSGVLTLAAVDRIVIAGSFSGIVHCLDFRLPEKLFHKIKLGSKAFGLYVNSNGYEIVTGTEGGATRLYDRRNLDFPVKEAKMLSMSRNLKYSNGTQIAASNSTKTIIFNPSTLEIELDFTNATQIAPYYCIPTESGYICSDNYDISYYSGGQNPRKIAEEIVSNRVCEFKYFDGDLIAGLGEGSVQFWPREQLRKGRLNTNNIIVGDLVG